MKNKVLFVMFFVFIILFFSISTNNVSAETGCLFCGGDEKLYEQEKQFINRVKQIKLVYGESIDEVTLMATVLHREGAETAIGSRYDKDYKESNYQQALREQNDMINNSGEITENSTSNLNDLLDAAAIIMSNSSPGKFDEEAYKKALAGDGIAACGEAFLSVFPSILDVFTGQGTTRFETMSKICEKGYIEAVYELEGVDDRVKQTRKEAIAQNIIDLAHYYKAIIGGEEENTCSVTTKTGDYANWKQFDDEWGSMNLGNSGDSVHNAGCGPVSLAMLLAKSGTKITNLPSGYTAFNPGAFVTALNNNDGFDGFHIIWEKASVVAPNWRVADERYDISDISNNTAALAKVLSQELSTPVETAEGKFQKFLILHVKGEFAHGGEASHYVALDTVSGDSVTIMDPGSSRGNTFDDNYNDWTVDWYAIFYATDVPFGGSGSSSSDNSSSVTPANPSSFNVQHEAKWQHGDLPKDKVKYIVLHDTESGTDDAQAIINAWKNNVIASHFIVDKNGTIYQTVPIDKIAHHAGEGTSGANNSFEIVQERDDMVGASSTSDYAMNAWSIGIEMIHEHDGSEYPEAQLNAVDSLIAYLDQELGHTPTIIDHKGWSGSRKQDVDDSFPLEKYKTSRAHSGSANNCVTDGLSTDLGEGNKIDVPAEVPLRWGGTMQQSGISWDDVEYKNYLSGGSRLRWTAGEVYRAWVAAGTKSDKGLATLNGRYLAATSQMFGETGDAVDVVLESGHVIKLVMSDTKGEDAPSVWGHEQNIYSTGGTGISMVEWEGYEGYSSTNPAFPEWTEQKIVYVVNYGSYLSRLNN